MIHARGIAPRNSYQTKKKLKQMSNLRDWKSNKFDEYRAKVKAQVSEGIAVSSDHIIDIGPKAGKLRGEIIFSGNPHNISSFFTLGLMLGLLVFIGEAVRDALDTRKTFK